MSKANAEEKTTVSVDIRTADDNRFTISNLEEGDIEETPYGWVVVWRDDAGKHHNLCLNQEYVVSLEMIEE